MQLTLREACDLRGWTFEQLAAKLKIAKTTIYRLNSGQTRPFLDTANALEDALHLKRGTLVFGRRKVAKKVA